tara:strand:+ start:169 stop:345 length:177 start_codon:yes stop_codon:yes gene_type:complete
MRRLVMTILSECRLPHCDNEFEFGNNGLPLIQGEVCDECNSLVVMARLQLMERSNGTK